MARRWQRKALKAGWTPPADTGGPSVTPFLILGGLATGFGLAWLLWENVGRELAQDGALAALPAPASDGPAHATRDRAGEPSPDHLEAIASEVSPAALTDGEVADQTAAPAETAVEPPPRARRKSSSETATAAPRRKPAAPAS